MPTRPVESVTPERSLRTSSWQSSSASGRFIEIALKDDCRSERMRGVLVFASAAARLAQMRFRRHRGQALIGERYWKLEAPLQPPREAPGASRHVVLAAVHSERQADHQFFGPPFAHERLDLRHAPAGACRLEHSQGIGEPRFGVTPPDADPAPAEIERAYGVPRTLPPTHRPLV